MPTIGGTVADRSFALGPPRAKSRRAELCATQNRSGGGGRGCGGGCGMEGPSERAAKRCARLWLQQQQQQYRLGTGRYEVNQSISR